jgi:hypothetical protein
MGAQLRGESRLGSGLALVRFQLARESRIDIFGAPILCQASTASPTGAWAPREPRAPLS